jgi:hypothetical protein
MPVTIRLSGGAASGSPRHADHAATRSKRRLEGIVNQHTTMTTRLSPAITAGRRHSATPGYKAWIVVTATARPRMLLVMP